MFDDWPLMELGIADSMLDSIVLGMQQVMKREEMFKKMERSSRFVRATEITDQKAHNYMIEQVIEDSMKKGRRTREKRSNSDEMEMIRKRCMNLTEANRDSECSTCIASAPYRTISGCCNNVANERYGEANQAFKRLLCKNIEHSVQGTMKRM